MASYDGSTLLNNAGVSLEQTSFDQFGAAVDDFSRQDLTPTISSSTLTGQNVSGTASAQTNPDTSSTWASLDYATDLVALAPKHRFLFKVHFHFNAPYVGDRDQSVFSYLIKSISRPRMGFEYVDLNMYNFNTKVLTKIKHEPLTIDFYDDIGNNVQEFFNTYRRAYSPIARTKIETASPQFETSGMNFASPNPYTTLGGDYSANAGQLVNGALNILHYIELEQYFAHGTQMNVFKFINPRAESFEFDDSSVDGSDLHSMKVTFNYDALIIDTHDSSSVTAGTFGTKDIMSSTTPFGNSTNNKSSVKASASALNTSSDSSYTIYQAGQTTGMITDTTTVDSAQTTATNKTLFGASATVSQSSAGVFGAYDSVDDVSTDTSGDA